MYRNKLLALLLLSQILACGNNIHFDYAEQSMSFKQTGESFRNQVDILWVIDNSGSMAPIQANLANNFNSFISDFQTKGYDFQMAVTTTDAYLANPAFLNDPTYSRFKDGTDQTSHTGVFLIIPQTPNLNNVFVTNATQGTSGTGDERAFSSFREALLNTSNPQLIRRDSFLAVVLISDEDDFSNPSRCHGCGIDHDYSNPQLETVDSYLTFLDAVTLSNPTERNYNVSAITVDTAACAASYGIPQATRYIDIVQRTNGILGSVCDASFANSLSAIRSRIFELSTQFVLSMRPNIHTIVVKVNGSLVPMNPQNGWSYNPTANSIMFHGSHIPARGANIEIKFKPIAVKAGAGPNNRQ